MNLRKHIIDQILAVPHIHENSHAQELLQFSEDRIPGAWRLPSAACVAAGGEAEDALPAAASLASAQIAIILIDDILDEDPRGTYHRIGSGAAANLAVSFQAAAGEILLTSSLTEANRIEASRLLSQMSLTTALGQHLDSKNPATEEEYWSVVRTKSSPFFETAFALGAMFAEAGSETVALMASFGTVYGEMVQIFDDLHDSMESTANPDWLNGRYPLPLLYATVVSHKDREKFLALRPNVADEVALQEAQDILISSGAVSYCINELIQRHRSAEEMIQEATLQDTSPLEQLLNEFIGPVQNLIEIAGKSNT